MWQFYQKYKPIIFFYLIACLLSWPFFFWRDVYPISWNNFSLDPILKTSLIMWGPGIAAIITSYIFKNRIKKTIHFFGSSAFKSCLFWGIPMAVFLFFGNYGKNGVSIWWYLLFYFRWGTWLERLSSRSAQSLAKMEAISDYRCNVGIVAFYHTHIIRFNFSKNFKTAIVYTSQFSALLLVRRECQSHQIASCCCYASCVV